MSKAVEQATASASTDMSALSVTPFTVVRALASVLECSYCSLLSMSCRAQNDPCMTLYRAGTLAALSVCGDHLTLVQMGLSRPHDHRNLANRCCECTI